MNPKAERDLPSDPESYSDLTGFHQLVRTFPRRFPGVKPGPGPGLPPAHPWHSISPSTDADIEAYWNEIQTLSETHLSN